MSGVSEPLGGGTITPTRPDEAIDHDVAAPPAVGGDADAGGDDREGTGLAALREALTSPAKPVTWSHQWNEQQRVVVESPEHLGTLVATLVEIEDYGGVTLTGSAGPWSQIMYFGKGEYLVELHPHEHGDTGPDMYFERVVPVTAAQAGRIAWDWVRTGRLPEEHDIEFRVVPEGQVTDVDL